MTSPQELLSLLRATKSYCNHTSIKQEQAQEKALQSFKDFIAKLFCLSDLQQANDDNLNAILHTANATDKHPLIIFTDTDHNANINKSQLEHNKLGFVLFPIPTPLTNSKLAKLTRAINQETSSYTICFFICYETQELSIDFATRRTHKHDTNRDILHPPLLIKNISIITQAKDIKQTYPPYKKPHTKCEMNP